MPTYKYLGVLFQEHLQYDQHVTNISKAGGHALGAIMTKNKRDISFGYETYQKLYDVCIVPGISYGVAVWGRMWYSACDEVQLRVQRYFAGLDIRSTKAVIDGDFAWAPVVDNWKMALAFLR